MEKIILYKHGISVNGELQIHRINRFIEGGEIKHEIVDLPVSPIDYQKMESFDMKSQQIVEALYVQDVIEEVQQNIAYYNEKLALPGFREVIRYDRMLDDLYRVSIRQRNELIENGIVISLKYHRSWIMPGGTYLDKDILSKTLAETFHTPDVIADYQTAMEEAGAFEDGLNGEEIIT